MTDFRGSLPMSTLSNQAPEIDIPRLLTGLRDLSKAFVEGQQGRYGMRIPAEPYRDGDLVCGSAARLIERLLSNAAYAGEYLRRAAAIMAMAGDQGVALSMHRHAERILEGLSEERTGDRASSAVRDVLSERARQVSEEGYSREHDDEHNDGALAKAGACYALCAGIGLATAEGSEAHYEFVKEYATAGCPSELWPWSAAHWKPKNPRRDLVRAGALIIAEIERIDRLNYKTETRSEESCSS